MSRPTAEDRRLDYLRIGADIVGDFERAPSAPMAALANIKIADVAERAQVTKGALYHIWPSQEAYRRDLMAHLLRIEGDRGAEDASEGLRIVIPAAATPEERLHLMCDASFDRLKGDPAHAARFSFYLFAGLPEIRSLLERPDDEIEMFWVFIDSYFSAAGRRLRPSYSKRTVYGVITAFFDGLVLRHRTSPSQAERTVEHNGAQWKPYPYGVLSLLEYFSEPVEAETVEAESVEAETVEAETVDAESPEPATEDADRSGQTDRS